MKLEAQSIRMRSELVQRLQVEERPEVLAAIQAILDGAETDFWDKLTADQKISIEQGIEEARSGKTVPAREFLARLKR